MKYAVLLLFVLLASTILFFSCNSSKQSSSSEASIKSNIKTAEKRLVSIKKGPCHGKCPIYSMTIYNSGKVEYIGERFCDKLGVHNALLPSSDLNLLKAKVDNLNMDNYPDKIESMIPDFPSTEITCYNNAQVESVWWRNNAPTELSDLASILDKYRESLDWKIDTRADLASGSIDDQLIIHLKEGLSASDFSKQYRAYDLVPIKALMPDMNYWLFEFDKTKITSIEMLNLINKSDNILNVEFNKKIDQRN